MKVGYSFDSLAAYLESVDASAVKTTGTQTIGGAKTFSTNPLSTAAQSTGANALVRYDTLANYVKRAGDTMTGRLTVSVNGEPIRLVAAAGQGSYILSQVDGENHWNIGKTSPNTDDVAISSYIHNTNIILQAAKVVANKDLYVGSNKVFHQGFKPTAADVGAQPLDATLTALAGMVTAADKLPYFIGADQTALTTFTAYARTLLDDVNAAGMLTTLGVSSFIQGLLNDPDVTAALGTLNAVSKGIVLAIGTDLNTIKTSGFYRLAGTAAHHPNVPVGSSGYGQVIVSDGLDTTTQIYSNYNDNKVWIRSMSESLGWTPWAQLYSTTHKPTAADVGLTTMSQAATAYTLAQRDASGDIAARLLKTSYADEAAISGAIAFRKNNSSDSFTRYCNNPSAIRTWLGALATTGNAASASKWATARTLTLSGDATGSVAFDGSGNIALSVAVANNSHSLTAALGNSDIVASSYGQVGTYGFLRNGVNVNTTVGTTAPGSSLVWSSGDDEYTGTTSPAGTWKCLGYATATSNTDSGRRSTLWIRIA